MGNIFRTRSGRGILLPAILLPSGRTGALSVACLFAFYTIRDLRLHGWQSLAWIPGLLLVIGYLAISRVAEEQEQKSRRFQIAVTIYVAAYVLAIVVMVYSYFFST